MLIQSLPPLISEDRNYGIYVGNLAGNVSSKDLEQLFELTKTDYLKANCKCELRTDDAGKSKVSLCKILCQSLGRAAVCTNTALRIRFLNLRDCLFLFLSMLCPALILINMFCISITAAKRSFCNLIIYIFVPFKIDVQYTLIDKCF